jgi:hypothetical protein
LFGVAEPECHDVFITYQRCESIDVGQHGGASTRNDGQIHRGDFAIRLCLWLVEVGVTIDEEQSVSSDTSERDHDANDVAAVAAEHDRELVFSQRAGYSLGKLLGVGSESLRIQQQRFWIALRVITRRWNKSAVLGLQTRLQTCCSMPRW